jgi:Skp family chaperone for outer membrane proteins
MKKFAISAAVAAIVISMSSAAPAQRGNSDILVVDTERLLSECNACRAASTQLQQQMQQYQQFGQSLQTPLQTEGTQLQTAIQALNGRQPDAALQARIQAFSAREQTANQQLAQRQQTIRSTQAHVTQQLGNRLTPILEQIRNTRRASVVLAKQGTLASDNALDVTNEALAELNRQLPSVSVTPLPQGQAAPQQPQPQGR